MHQIPFYDELSIEKTSEAFKRYTRSHKSEIRDSKDHLAELESSKLSIKILFKGLLAETKIFKYQITVKFLLRKHKENEGIELAPVYFNSTTKTVINSNIYLINIFKKFCIELIIGLIKGLVG